MRCIEHCMNSVANNVIKTIANIAVNTAEKLSFVEKRRNFSSSWSSISL